jgi:5'-nucleotidase (lipoprotein e(P4) family)
MAGCSSLHTNTAAVNSLQSDSVEQCADASAPVQSAYHWIDRSAEYQWNSELIYQLAARRVYEFVGGETQEKWGVILDLDETVLDNRKFQQALSEQGEGYSQQRWNSWVMTQQSELVPGSLFFLREVKRLGGLVVFVSNRSVAVTEATRQNLESLAVPFDDLYLMDKDKGKQERWKRALAQYEFTPVLWVGDQLADFPLFEEDYTADHCPEFSAAYGYPLQESPLFSEQLGRCIFVIANPMYGRWSR